MRSLLLLEIGGEVYIGIAYIFHLYLQVFFHVQKVLLEKGDGTLDLFELMLTSYSKGTGFGCEVYKAAGIASPQNCILTLREVGVGLTVLKMPTRIQSIPKTT